MDRDHKRALPFRLRTVLYSFQPAATGVRLPGRKLCKAFFFWLATNLLYFFYSIFNSTFSFKAFAVTSYFFTCGTNAASIRASFRVKAATVWDVVVIEICHDQKGRVSTVT